MCKSKKLKNKMVELFEEKVGKIKIDDNVSEPAQYIISPIEREIFKKAIQAEFPDLRYRNISGLNTIDDFAVKIEKEIDRREEFFAKALDLIRRITGHSEYTLDSVLFAECLPQHTSGNERLSEEANYFIRCQKVYYALAHLEKEGFQPASAKIESSKNLKQLIDLYYRRGRF